MGWHTGTATNYRDLLDKVRGHAVADGWTVQRYVQGQTPPIPPYLAPMDELILRGPGFGAGYPVYVGIRTLQDPGNNLYCFSANGMTSYGSGLVYGQQLNLSPPVYMNLWNVPMTYWLSVSDRRILLIAKCSNTYHSLYLGFILPFSSPIEYPYPCYVASDSPTPQAFGNVDAATRGINAPGYGGAYLRDASGVWRPVAVLGNGASREGWQTFGQGNYTIWPYNGGLSYGDTPSLESSLPQGARFEPVPGYAASMPMMPCYVMPMFDKGGFTGVLENVYWIPGNTMSAEQELDNGSDTYRVFIQISRSFEQPSPYYAVKEA